MDHRSQSAAAISHAQSADSKCGQSVIKLLENVTGRLALIMQFEQDMAEVLPNVTEATRDIAIAIAELPLQIRGFGPVKFRNQITAGKRREELLAAFRTGCTHFLKAVE